MGGPYYLQHASLSRLDLAQLRVRQHEQKMWAAAKTLDEYNLRIKQAFEAGKSAHGMPDASRRSSRMFSQNTSATTGSCCERLFDTSAANGIHSVASPSTGAERTRPEHDHVVARCDGDALREYCHSGSRCTCAFRQTGLLILLLHAAIAAPTQPVVAAVAPSSMPSGTFGGISYQPPVVKAPSAMPTQFNKLPPKPAAHAAPLKAPATYQPPPTAAPPPAVAAPAIAATPVSAAAGTQPLTPAEMLADEKCWQKLEQMRAKFEAPLRTIYETLLMKQGRDDANLVPVQKMVCSLRQAIFRCLTMQQIEFLTTPREGRPKRSYEDLEKTEQKMRQYFERMYQKVGIL